MAVSHLLYLHGFRSSPRSTKARQFAARVAQLHPSVTWWCPQLPPSPREAMELLLQGVQAWPKDAMAVAGSSLGGFYATAVPYVPAPRHGNSRSLRPIRILLDGLTASTTWPLRLVSLMGFAVASMAFVYGGYLSFRFFLYGHTVSGLTTIVVGLMLYSGIQLFSLGIVGEYVGRIFEEAMERPLFVVKRELGHGLKVTRP